MTYHIPVMLTQAIDGLHINPNGTYADLTFGGGGHSKKILESLKDGKLYAFDQDADAVKNAEGLSENLTLIEGNFRFMSKYLKMYGVKEVDGILADLGVSSHQFDEAERGFSFRYDGRLDMRMDQEGEKSAFDVINTYEEKDLVHLFSMYGEVKNAKTLAAAICTARINQKITSTAQFKELIAPLAPRKKENQYLAQVFQALRIEVNDEVAALKEMLNQAVGLLKKGGRLVVISYHSLEDRLVKNLINKGNIEGKEDKDFYGNINRPLKAISRKPLVPEMEEIAQNPRARSAKLRIAEKL